MKVNLIPAPSVYPQGTAQDLLVGQCVRYPAGNFVIRLNTTLWLSGDPDGKLTSTKDKNDLGHGEGDLMPKGTELYIKL